MEGRHPEQATDWKGLRERKKRHLVGSESTWVPNFLKILANVYIAGGFN